MQVEVVPDRFPCGNTLHLTSIEGGHFCQTGCMNYPSKWPFMKYPYSHLLQRVTELAASMAIHSSKGKETIGGKLAVSPMDAANFLLSPQSFQVVNLDIIATYNQLSRLW